MSISLQQTCNFFKRIFRVYGGGEGSEGNREGEKEIVIYLATSSQALRRCT